MEQFILTVPVLHTTVPIVRLFGQLKADIERSGQPLPDADILIAATSLACCDRLVTGNVAHFRRFPSLSIEDWLR